MTNLALVTTIPMLIVTAQWAPEIPRFEMGHPVECPSVCPTDVCQLTPPKPLYLSTCNFI